MLILTASLSGRSDIITGRISTGRSCIRKDGWSACSPPTLPPWAAAADPEEEGAIAAAAAVRSAELSPLSFFGANGTVYGLSGVLGRPSQF